MTELEKFKKTETFENHRYALLVLAADCQMQLERLIKAKAGGRPAETFKAAHDAMNQLHQLQRTALAVLDAIGRDLLASSNQRAEGAR